MTLALWVGNIGSDSNIPSSRVLSLYTSLPQTITPLSMCKASGRRCASDLLLIFSTLLEYAAAEDECFTSPLPDCALQRAGSDKCPWRKRLVFILIRSEFAKAMLFTSMLHQASSQCFLQFVKKSGSSAWKGCGSAQTIKQLSLAIAPLGID